MLSICAFYLCRAEEQRALRKKARKKIYKGKNPEKKNREKKIFPSGIRTSTKAHPRSEVKCFIHLAMESQVYR